MGSMQLATTVAPPARRAARAGGSASHASGPRDRRDIRRTIDGSRAPNSDAVNLPLRVSAFFEAADKRQCCSHRRGKASRDRSPARVRLDCGPARDRRRDHASAVDRRASFPRMTVHWHKRQIVARARSTLIGIALVRAPHEPSEPAATGPKWRYHGTPGLNS